MDGWSTAASSPASSCLNQSKQQLWHTGDISPNRSKAGCNRRAELPWKKHKFLTLSSQVEILPLNVQLPLPTKKQLRLILMPLNFQLQLLHSDLQTGVYWTSLWPLKVYISLQPTSKLCNSVSSTWILSWLSGNTSHSGKSCWATSASYSATLPTFLLASHGTEI